MSQKPVHHAIDYIEFPVTDLPKAKDFYGKVFGWQFTDYGPGYAGIKREGGEMGGLSLQEETPKRGGPLVVLYSEDFDTTFSKVQSSGAEVLQDIFEFPGGRRFHFADPSGNELAVWTHT